MKKLILGCAALASVFVVAACSKKPEASSVAAVNIDPVRLRMFQPLPESVSGFQNFDPDPELSLAAPARFGTLSPNSASAQMRA